MPWQYLPKNRVLSIICLIFKGYEINVCKLSVSERIPVVVYFNDFFSGFHNLVDLHKKRKNLNKIENYE